MTTDSMPEIVTQGTSEAPLLISASLKTNDRKYKVSAELIDLYGNEQIRISGPDGKEMFVTHELMELIGENYENISNSLSEKGNKLRHEYVGSLTEYGLTKNTKYLDSYTLLGENIAIAGTPYLTWKRMLTKNGEQPGWEIKLSSADSISLGYAQWDDREGFAALVSTMADKEGLILAASLMGSETSKNLALEMFIDKAKTENRIPFMSASNVAFLLNGTKTTNRNSINRYEFTDQLSRRRGNCLITAIYLKNSGSKTAVAVAVLPPIPKLRGRTRNESSLSSESFEELQKIRKQKRETAWVRHTISILAKSGYRLINLPQPKDLGSQWPNHALTLYFTRTSSEVWAELENATIGWLQSFSLAAETSFF